jgi:hypothetical protein
MSGLPFLSSLMSVSAMLGVYMIGRQSIQANSKSGNVIDCGRDNSTL